MYPYRAPVLVVLALISCGPGLVVFGLPTEDLASSAILASPDEPGEPLYVSGTVYGSDGKTPAAGVVLYVYHTDARGYYGEGMMDNDRPRLNARITTDGQGRYELRTIRPGPYPHGGVPAHIHYVAEGGGYLEQSFELQFDGDPEIGEDEAERSRKLGRFGSVRPVARDQHGVFQVVYDLRLRD